MIGPCQFLKLSTDGNIDALVKEAEKMGFQSAGLANRDEQELHPVGEGYILFHYHNLSRLTVSRLIEAAHNAGFTTVEIFEPKETNGDSSGDFMDFEDFLEQIMKNQGLASSGAPRRTDAGVKEQLLAELQKSSKQPSGARFNIGFRFSTIGSPWYIRFVNWVLGRKEKGVTIAVKISA